MRFSFGSHIYSLYLYLPLQFSHTQTRTICFGHYLVIKDGNTDGFTTTIVDVDLTDFGKPAFQPKEAKCDPRANSHRRDGQGKPAFQPKEAKCDPRANSHRRNGQGKPGFQQTNWALVC